MWTKREPVPVSPLDGIPEHAKELFEILEMRSLTIGYFGRFNDPDPRRDPGTPQPVPDVDGGRTECTWMIGLLHDTDRFLNQVTTGPVALTPVLMRITPQSLILFDEASATPMLWSAWDRMCRIDLRPFEGGSYQVLALSHFNSPLAVSERFGVGSSIPLDPAEVEIRYLYTHAGPATFQEIDRHWRQVHIPQDLHRLPCLLG
jgi:hypothetical protein